MPLLAKALVMKMLAAVTAAFAVKYLLAMPGVAGAGSTDGINSMALQQGGLGLLLTTMIISAPPMAAAFFQGTLGQFNAYSPFGHIKPEPQGGRGGGGYGPPGSPSYTPPPGELGQRGDRNGQSSGSPDPFSQATGPAMSTSDYQQSDAGIPRKERETK